MCVKYETRLRIGNRAVKAGIGDQPFKQPAAFTRRILFNLEAGPENAEGSRAAWAQLADRILTPPYLSSEADVTHSRLNRSQNAAPGVPNQFLILCTDGLSDLFEGIPAGEHAQRYVDAVVPPAVRDERAMFSIDDNLALRVLKSALGGDDSNALSQMITVESSRPWLDDITVLVQIL